MVSDYRCASCSLRVSVGSYHYHQIDTGFGGRALWACVSCGAQHAVELALTDRGPQAYAVFDLTIESLPERAHVVAIRLLRAEKKLALKAALEAVRVPPLLLYEKTWKEKAENAGRALEALGATVSIAQKGLHDNAAYGPIQQNRLLFRSGPVYEEAQTEWLKGPSFSEYEPPDRRCLVCGVEGSLVQELAENTACPSCAGGTLSVESEWIT